MRRYNCIFEKRLFRIEEKNFEACASAALRDNAGKRMSQSEIKTLFPHTFSQIDRAIKLIGEFSICTTALFNHLDSFVKTKKLHILIKMYWRLTVKI